MRYSGARILVEELIRQGVQTVFGYPGGAVLDLYEQLYLNADRIEHITTAHEQGAIHAADGYARVSAKPGVVIATSGPGATNLITGIATAYLDSVPLVAITGNVSVSLLGKDSFQEVDIIGISQSIVKHSFLVKHVSELERCLQQAFAIAMSGRKGPVLVDIPKNVQQELWEYPCYQPMEPLQSAALPELNEAVTEIMRSAKPYLYCGGGVIASHAEAEVLQLSERLSAPIGLSMMGLTAVPNSYELNLGMSGMHGSLASALAQSEADLMIAIGVRFSDRATGNIEAFTKQCKVIHIDIDEAEFEKNVANILELKGDCKAILRGLLEVLPAKANPTWREFQERNIARDALNADAIRFSPRNILRVLHEFCSEDTVVATDVGQHQMWVMQHYPFEKPRTLLTSGGLGTMGYGFGAAIGGCIANGKRKTVLVTGDGSFGMNLIEFATAVAQRLPILIVLFNNGVLGMVRQWQDLFYEQHFSATTLAGNTNYCALAEAFGAKGYRIETLHELREVLMQDLTASGPVLLDCRIDKDEKVFPMIPPGGSVRDIRTQ